MGYSLLKVYCTHVAFCMCAKLKSTLSQRSTAVQLLLLLSLKLLLLLMMQCLLVQEKPVLVSFPSALS